MRLLQGLAQGCHAEIAVTICNLEEPCRTWEGVFRSVGIVLNQLHLPPAAVELSALEGAVAEPEWTRLGLECYQPIRRPGRDRAPDGRESSPRSR